MRGRYYAVDNRNKKLTGNSKASGRGSAVIYYLDTWNNYTAAKEEEADRKRAIISVSIIIASLILYTMVVMRVNNI